MGSTSNHIVVNIMLSRNAGGSYQWSYSSDYRGFDPLTGRVTLKDHGETAIQYVLQGTAYELVYVNLDTDTVATHQIKSVVIDSPTNSITVTDGNTKGHTGTTPFGLRFIARPAGDIGTVIVSPDPEVINDPVSSGG